MNIYSVFVALLANSISAHYPWIPYSSPPPSQLSSIHHNQYTSNRYQPSLLASNPPNGATCYRGNMKQYPASGGNTPPCWYQEPDSSYSCYEYEPGTQRCPNFPNRVNKPGNGNSSQTCYRGNMKQYPTSGGNTPPCWYREPDGSNSCYEYEQGTQRCPNFPNPIRKPSFYGSDDPQPGDKCYYGNQRNIAPATQAPYPPCWYKQSDGQWACFDKKNGQCEWNGAKNPPNSGSEGITTCYAGSMKQYPVIKNHPPCWYKQNDGSWACFEKIDDQCPWDGAVGPQTSAYLNNQPAAEYTEEPNILHAIREFLLTFQ